MDRETVTQHNRVEELAARIVSDSLHSTGLRRLTLSVADTLVQGWSRGRPLKLALVRPIRRLISRGMKSDGKAAPGTFPADLGKLITAWSARVSADHAEDPACHARAREHSLRSFVENTDFGEVCGMVQGSQECVVKTVEALNEQLWKYPAKVASILGAVLAAINTSIRAVRELMRPVEKNVAPDLLADLVLSLLKGIDARSAGELSNSALELVRRIHTGSLLLGRAGRPLFQVYLTELLKGVAHQIDPQLLGKARIALAEDRQSVSSALADALQENPELVLALVSALGAAKNSAITSRAHRLKVLSSLDPERLNQALARAGSDFDTFEAAEVANTLFLLINRLHDTNPGLFTSVARGVADSLDPQEIRQTLQWLVPELIDAFRPVLEEVLPVLISGLCEMIGPDGGCASPEQEQAIHRLRAVLGTSVGES